MSVPVEAYARQMKALLPRGAFWKLEPESWLSKFLLGLAGEFARLDARAQNLLDEWDPRTTVETLPEWERVVGIPDAETPVGATTTERQSNVTRKVVARGGATPAYFVELARLLGYTVAIVENPGGVANTWRMDVSPPYAATTTYFRAGSRCGSRLYVKGDEQFEAVINRWKPAHTAVSFSYL